MNKVHSFTSTTQTNLHADGANVLRHPNIESGNTVQYLPDTA